MSDGSHSDTDDDKYIPNVNFNKWNISNYRFTDKVSLNHCQIFLRIMVFTWEWISRNILPSIVLNSLWVEISWVNKQKSLNVRPLKNTIAVFNCLSIFKFIWFSPQEYSRFRPSITRLDGFGEKHLNDFSSVPIFAIDGHFMLYKRKLNFYQQIRSKRFGIIIFEFRSGNPDLTIS